MIVFLHSTKLKITLEIHLEKCGKLKVQCLQYLELAHNKENFRFKLSSERGFYTMGTN